MTSTFSCFYFRSVKIEDMCSHINQGGVLICLVDSNKMDYNAVCQCAMNKLTYNKINSLL